MRSELVGEPTAKRLASVDKEESDFEQRFIKYKQQKKSILSHITTTNSQYSQEIQQNINQLEQSLFSESERKRLVGYESVYNSKK